MDSDELMFDEAADEVVDLANRLAGQHPDTDLWDIADGLLAGVVHYWLFSRKPCGDPACEDCAPIATAQLRLEELTRLIRQSAEESDLFHQPEDTDVGRA
jgi:hypothetical protein